MDLKKYVLDKSRIKSENNIIRTPENELKIPIDGGLGQIIFHKMKEHSDKIIHIDSETDEKDTFKSLLSRSIRFALVLKAKGVTKDDIICSCINKDLNACIPLIACLFIGAKSVYIDPVSLNYSIDSLLKQINPKYFIVLPEILEIIEDNLKLRSQKSDFIIYGKSDKHPEFSSFLQIQNEADEKNFQPIFVQDLNEIALLMLSSGTSDVSKLIPISHLLVIYKFFREQSKENFDLELIVAYLKLKNCVLCHYSYNWISSMCTLIGCLMSGTPQLVTSEFNIDKFWNVFIKYKPCVLLLSLYQANEILKSANQLENNNFASIILIAGDVISKELVLQFRKSFPNKIILQVYGLTENFGDAFTLDLYNKYHRYVSEIKPNTCGFPMLNYSYKIVDIDTEKALGPNQEGELRIKSKYFMKNYYNSDRTKDFDSEGFFKTGDIAYYDEDYCFFIIDRIKHLIFYKTNKLRPIYMETVLLSHPAVKKCAVIGIPNETDIAHPMALVILNETYKNITVKELQEFYDSKVDDLHKLRGGIKFVKTIPVTSNDKVTKCRALKMVNLRRQETASTGETFKKKEINYRLTKKDKIEKEKIRKLLRDYKNQSNYQPDQIDENASN